MIEFEFEDADITIKHIAGYVVENRIKNMISKSVISECLFKYGNTVEEVVEKFENIEGIQDENENLSCEINDLENEVRDLEEEIKSLKEELEV